MRPIGQSVGGESLEEARNIFRFAAPVRAKDGREGVVKIVPDDDLIVVVAFPVTPEQKDSNIKWIIEQQKIPCSELERIWRNPPPLTGFRVV